MKFSLKRTGFTMGEVLICLVIVTILTIFSIVTIRPKSNTTPLLYYRAYDALSIAAYNAWLEAGDRGVRFGNNVSTLCKQLAGASMAVDGYDGYINVADNQAYCSRAGIAVPTSASENFNSNNVHFVSTNSMRFYISSDLRTTYPISTNYDSKTTASTPDASWYIVFVDLDGEKGLNSMKQPRSKNNTADIVPFVIVAEGDEMPSVIPIGFPSMDKRYMTAVVKYTNSESNNNQRRSPSVTYKEAVTRAYGKQISKGSSEKTILPERIHFESFLGKTNTLFYVAPPVGIDVDDDSKIPFGITKPGCHKDYTEGACRVIVNSYTGAGNR